MGVALYLANRVKESCNGSGTGNLVLTGAVSGFRTFADAIPTGSKVAYLIQDGFAWEVGIGTLSSETELSRDTVLDSSDTTTPVNNVAPGSPVKISLSDSPKTVGITPEATLALTKNSDGVLADPSPFRATVYLETIEDMKAEEGVGDDEIIFCAGDQTMNDGGGGIFYYDADDATSPDNVDTFRNDNSATGLHKRIKVDIQGIVHSGDFEVNAKTADSVGASIYMFFRKKATQGTAWARWLADYTNSRLSLGIRYGQSSAEKLFAHFFSIGDNRDRIELTEPVVLPTRTNSNGLQTRGLSFLSAVSRLALARSDAASGSAADYSELPITKGGYFAAVVPTITALKAIDAVVHFADGDRAMVVGTTAEGDQLPFIVKWTAASSATADDWSVFRPSVGAAASGNGRWLRINVTPSRNFTNSDATPSVANGSFFVTAGTPPAAITAFDDAHEQQRFTIQRGTVDQVIEHNSAIDLPGGVDYTLTAENPRIDFVHVGGVSRAVGGASLLSDEAVATAISEYFSGVPGCHLDVYEVGSHDIDMPVDDDTFTDLFVWLRGAGGGGGACKGNNTASNGGAASGGGAGALIIHHFTKAQLSATETLVVGAKGIGGTDDGGGNPTNGTAGANTTFKSLTAGGGSPGLAATASSNMSMRVGGSGGTASGTINILAARGMAGLGNQQPTTDPFSGAGGSCLEGGGGKQLNAGSNSGAAGQDASGRGAGGSGAVRRGTEGTLISDGGDGADGIAFLLFVHSVTTE